jgi:DNA-binding transcriptional ArsR family regulator
MDWPEHDLDAEAALIEANGLSAITQMIAPAGISARDLMGKTFPPIKYVVSSYLVEGLTVFAGAPKLGKSWLALAWALCVAGGGHAFGSIPCEAGDVLYLALEDNERRLQSRLRYLGIVNAPERLTFYTAWPDLDGECIPRLRAWLENAEAPRLVIVDVFAKVRGTNSGRETQYEADYRFAAMLQQIALEFGVSIVLVHHTRKMEADDPFDSVSGTRGLTGAADTVLVLKRDMGAQHTVLYGRGRDLEEIETALQFEGGHWSILGDASMIAKTEERQEIIEVLGRSVEPMTPSEIADTLGKTRTNISHRLAKLFNEGKVAKHPKGRWSLVPCHSGHSGHSPGKNVANQPVSRVTASDTPCHSSHSSNGAEIRHFPEQSDRSDRSDRGIERPAPDYLAGWGTKAELG